MKKRLSFHTLIHPMELTNQCANDIRYLYVLSSEPYTHEEWLHTPCVWNVNDIETNSWRWGSLALWTWWREKCDTHKKRKTEWKENPTRKTTEYLCPLHRSKHKLNDCLVFRQKPLDERKKFLYSNGIFFKCCVPVKHYAKNCTTVVKCNLCNVSTHPIAFHKQQEVISACTQIFQTAHDDKSKSCAKILPVKVYPEGYKDLSRLTVNS